MQSSLDWKTAGTLVGGAWFAATTLQKLDGNQKATAATLATLIDNQKATDAKLATLIDNQKATDATLIDNQKATDAKLATLIDNQKATDAKLDAVLAAVTNMTAVLACLPRAFASVAVGLHEAAESRPVRVLVAASKADVAKWLVRVQFGKYADVLVHLDGAMLLLQTEASLLAAGVAPHHVAPLLKEIADAQARDTARMDDPEARAR